METDSTCEQSPQGKRVSRQRSTSLHTIEDSTLARVKAWQRARRDSEEGTTSASLMHTGSFTQKKDTGSFAERRETGSFTNKREARTGRMLNIADIYLYTELKSLDPKNAERFVREVLVNDLPAVGAEEGPTEEEGARAGVEEAEAGEADFSARSSGRDSMKLLRRSSSEGQFESVSAQLKSGQAASANSGLIYTSEAYLVEKEMGRSVVRDLHSDSTRSL
ncbi:hypothetical protein GUITHDRAFT_156426 [Guillardia theta CCMP2712]|uniref:Uncharacterized protein n=1 Tax=Guillardia theta (strain CCMP2712) TaxID=905079 RepID=L1I7K0_GUITC|nr:hypothetical protein GUITHDRAFT_156426 [Guillardia theta CCMP2712]EKX32067.1 hypothetical protein GUITHDRAFT_156426 [Guillardia theta CCMP2712]|eukprot:XP_005819047.1 hypothetical protein GUITHDRAFT_156426 [Guillardia theta CCMP2712]